MKAIYRITTESKASEANIIENGSMRLTLLTAALVRIEWSRQKRFVCSPTQKVWFRAFADVPFTRRDGDGYTLIETEKLSIRLFPADKLRDALRVTLRDPSADRSPVEDLCDSWRYGDAISTLKGTARTLDNADGAIELEDGMISRNGFTVLDDSASYLISPTGELASREDADAIDVYFFGYGRNYRACLADYLRLTGMPPLLPRWALGNWWSRYHKYTQQEYRELIERFEAEHIPLSVAMIDMDWHLTQIEKDIGTGWTGYTWNRELFPEPEALLSWLHGRGLKVSLNVHPAEGVGRHEAAYSALAQALELPADGKTIPFDIASPAFTEAYFDSLHRPLEAQGADFWWIDWQQGTKTAMPGLDPLWLLNHYHYLDNAKDGRRPLILSRYAGPGSQRYPVGFSGDSVISWKSLAFQPYFTATASNIGYGWWSHDIGGHMLGTYDEELQVRWVQFGVFSPIMRLHCSASPFNHKEPWKYAETEAGVITRYLRLRHRLIPYLYTMNERFALTGEALVAPMYHGYPKREEAYKVANEYFFGTELICAPVTEPVLPDLQRAAVSVWLPEGAYTDIFTGGTYAGGRMLTMYRPVQDIPVLLKAGGILPLAAESEIEAREPCPDAFDIYLAPGADGSFTLYEDDGESLAYAGGKSARTSFTLRQGKELLFHIHAAEGERSLLPTLRTYTLHFLNCNKPESLLLRTGGGETALGTSYSPLRREVTASLPLSPSEEAELALRCEETAASIQEERCFALLDKARIDFARKEALFAVIQAHGADALAICRELLQKKEEPALIEALLELLENT